MLQAYNPAEAVFRCTGRENCNEIVNRAHPEWVLDVHRACLAAGSDIVGTTPEEIGVKLTEGFMRDPEASVSALVFHHPDCAYFTAAVRRRCRAPELAES